MTDDPAHNHSNRASSSKEKNSKDPTTAWMEAAGGFWENLLKTWTHTLKTMDVFNPSKAASSSKSQSAFGTTKSAFDHFSNFAADPNSMESLFKGAGAMPQLLAKAAQSGLNGLLQYQQKWFDRAGKIGKTTEAYQFENLDENAFRAWTDVYETEFQRFFNVPQLGLTRFYQEKINAAMDKFNIYQSTMAEFQRLLYLPITRSLTVMQEQLGEMALEKPLPEDPKVYYNLWVKILEGHYMTLFQSPEYIQILGKTLNAMSDYSQAKNEIIQDMLGTLPIPTQKDVDELYREIYLLKKRIKALEK